MLPNVVVKRTGSENAKSLHRRFTRCVKSLGIISYLKRNKYHASPSSQSIRRKDCLNKLKRIRTYNNNVRMGKIPQSVRNHNS